MAAYGAFDKRAHIPAAGISRVGAGNPFCGAFSRQKRLTAAWRTFRGQGFARWIGGFAIDTEGFAAPVFDWHGKVIAAIGLAGVRSRFDKKDHSNLIRAVFAATKAFGGRMPEPDAAGQGGDSRPSKL